ncbi:MAG TPA: hypothetical protein VH682_04935 [Gemmataceae bacterium]|jgi:hypothetical protein
MRVFFASFLLAALAAGCSGATTTSPAADAPTREERLKALQDQLKAEQNPPKPTSPYSSPPKR